MKVLLLALLLSTSTFATKIPFILDKPIPAQSENGIILPQCVEGEARWINMGHLGADFCMNWLKVKTPSECQVKQKELMDKGLMDKTFEEFRALRNKQACK